MSADTSGCRIALCQDFQPDLRSFCDYIYTAIHEPKKSLSRTFGCCQLGAGRLGTGVWASNTWGLDIWAPAGLKRGLQEIG